MRTVVSTFEEPIEEQLERRVELDLNCQSSSSARKHNKRYGKNRISSSRYTWWSFIPLSLFEQFRTLDNFCLIILFIMYYFSRSPLTIFVIVYPLVDMIVVAIVKNGIDDFVRYLRDRRINHLSYYVLEHFPDLQYSKWAAKKAKDIRCGDIILLRENASAPCDLLLLGSSNEDGDIFATTDEVSGESGIKTFRAKWCLQAVFADLTQRLADDDYAVNDISFPRAVAHCDHPNPNMQEFEGSIEIGDLTTHLSTENLLLRASCLRGTTCIIGAAIYVGKDTKLSRNTLLRKHKTSTIVDRINFLFLVAALILLVQGLIYLGLQYHFVSTDAGKPWYIDLRIRSTWAGVQEFFTIVFMLEHMLPIAAGITVDFSELFLLVLILKDTKLSDWRTGVRAQANSTNLADELGQIEYMFCDKTGTLTENKLTLKCYTLADDPKVYVLKRRKGLGFYGVSDEAKLVKSYDRHQGTQRAGDGKFTEFEYFASDDSDSDSDSGMGLHRQPSAEADAFDTMCKRKARLKELDESTQMFWSAVSLCHSADAMIILDEETKEERISRSVSVKIG